MYFDIHSHILHNVDDGAKDLDVSLALLEKSYKQGVTDIISTPHFYPLDDSLEDFTERVEKSFREIKEATKDKQVPNIFLGCELLYYEGLSKATSLDQLTLGGSKYILLEPNYNFLNSSFQNELLKLREIGFTPIIAHIERFHKFFGFKKFLNFVKENNILTQVNATSFFSRRYSSVLKTLITKDVITYIASDTHSLDLRPPMTKWALEKIETFYGEEYKQKLINNSNQLLLEIAKKDFTV